MSDSRELIDSEEGPYTYEEWREYGYQVMSGEFATGRNEKGQAMFTREQVQFDTEESE